MRRSLTLGVLVALLVPSFAMSPVTATGKGSPPDYTSIRGLSKPKFDARRYEHMVEMKDGTEIYMEVVRPEATGRFPVILELSPYHGTLEDRSGTQILPGPGEDSTQLGLSGYFAPRGYAVAFADLRGTGRSGGCLDLLGDNDTSDAYEIVEWLGTQKWSSGRVGMTGHSFDAMAAIVAASQRPPHLKTIVPSAGTVDMYGHEYQQGVPYLDSFAGPAVAYQALAGIRHLPPHPIEEAPVQTGDAFGERATDAGCEWASSTVVNENVDYMSGIETEWHRERDHRKPAIASPVPVFAVHGVNDGAVRSIEMEWLAKRGNRRDKLWLGQWHHGTTDRPEPNSRADQWTYALHAWFDHYLQGRKIPTGPRVEVFLNDGSVFTSHRWPAKTKNLALYPGPDGRLSPTAPSTGTATFTATPAGAISGLEQGNGLSLIYETEPFGRDTLIVGEPDLLLSASTTSPRTHIIANAYVVSPEGDLSSTSVAWFAINPLVRDGIGKPAEVTPGEMMEMRLDGSTQAYLVQKGYRLRFVISSSDDDKLPLFATGSQITVAFGKKATRLTLPVIKEPRLHADPCGSCGKDQNE